MNSSPSGGEDLHMVQPEKSLPRAVNPAPPEEAGRAGPLAGGSGAAPANSGRFTFVASLLLIAITFSLGLSYFMEKRWLNRSATTQPNGTERTALVESSTVTAVPVPLGPDAFDVTAISLVDRPLAMINGKGVSEGDSLVVATSSGPVTARVEKIEEGVVHFIADGRKIEARMNSALAQKARP